MQLGKLQEIEAELTELGWKIVAISPELPDFQREEAEKLTLGYSVVSDAGMEAAKAFGIAHQAPEGYGSMIEKRAGQDHHLLPVPSVFLVSPDGVIQFTYVNPDYKIRMAPSVLLAAARAISGGETKE